MRERYAEIMKLDLTKATLAQVRERMSTAYNVKGSTLDRALRFFLSATEYSGIEASTFIRPKGTNGAGATKRRRTTKPKQAITVMDQPPMPPQPAQGASAKSVSLRSGGTVSVELSVDLFALAPEDRKFVFSLIDMLEEYRRTSKAADDSQQ